MTDEIQFDGLEAGAEDGAVFVEGPGIAATLSADAAAEAGRRLLLAAEIARTQIPVDLAAPSRSTNWPGILPPRD